MAAQTCARSLASVAPARAQAPSASARRSAPAAAPNTSSISKARFVVGSKAASLSAQRSVARSAVNTAIVASSVAQQTAVTGFQVKKGEKATFHFLVANAEFFVNDVQNEAFAEQLREKLRYYKEKDLPVDFWLVPEPAFLDSMPEIAKRVKRPAMALVSVDPVWTLFMKLRLDRVLKGEITATPEEVLKSTGELPKFDSGSKPWIAPYSKYSDGWWDMFKADFDEM